MNDFLHINVLTPAVVLTKSYVTSFILDQDGTHQEVGEWNQLIWYVEYTKGSLTSASFFLEKSPDGVNWFPEDAISFSGGTITLNDGTYTTTEDGNKTIAVAISARYARISVKGTGTVTGSLCGLIAYLQYV